jgi:hypothetical protein
LYFATAEGKLGVGDTVGVGVTGGTVGVGVAGTAEGVDVGAARVWAAIAWAVLRTSALESVGVPLERPQADRTAKATAARNFERTSLIPSPVAAELERRRVSIPRAAQEKVWWHMSRHVARFVR